MLNIDTLFEIEPTARPQAIPVSADEQLRLATLRRYDILDTAPELAFDDIAFLAAHICKAPIALVSFIDEDRQWFKSRVGIDSAQSARDFSFCTHTIRRPEELLVVTDALADPRFADSPLVAAGPRIRFYAGAPLVAPDGQVLGALCVKDIVPRELDATQKRALKALGRQVLALLELRRAEDRIAPVPQPSTRREFPRPDGQHVLYVDDDEAMLLAVERLLQRCGYRVSAFLDARVALAIAKLDPEGFDVAVCDFNLPALSGLDFARELASIRPQLPVIISSGYLPEAAEAEARQLGVRGLLRKQNTVDELDRLIQRVLSQP